MRKNLMSGCSPAIVLLIPLCDLPVIDALQHPVFVMKNGLPCLMPETTP